MQKWIPYAREREYIIPYKDIVLPHRFYADFVIHDKIILEIKSSKNGIDPVFIAQAINYLRVSGNRLALIVNFGREEVEYKRIVL